MATFDKEYTQFSKKADQSHGHQYGAENQEENEALSRKKFFDAERDYYLRGEEKEEFKMYDPNRLEEQATNQAQLTPQERLAEIDKQIYASNDREELTELVKAREQVTNEIEARKELEQAQELDQERDCGMEHER